MAMASVSAIPHPVRSWIQPVARLGYAAKGVVYITVGSLAVASARGRGGRRTPDTEGAIRTLGDQPWGDVLLVAVSVGLFAYAAWRVVQAVFDADQKGGGPQGLAVRSGFLGSGLVHLGLAITALSMARGQSVRRSDGIEQWTARVMSEPFGLWAVGAAGLGVVAAGLYQFYKAFSLKFEKRLALESLSRSWRTWVRRIGRIGLSARGVTFGIMGWFLVQAALQSDSGEARGLAGSLRVLRRQEHGDLLLGAVGVGLVAYGLHAFVIARYRRLPR
jgi:hypothetical protein